MAQVLVRNLDAAVVENLRARARLRGRSLEAELRDIINRAGLSAGARHALSFEEFDKTFGPLEFAEDPVDIIREEREGRGCT